MEDKTIALLVDMDNVSAKYVKNIFDELNEYGIVSIRRIYGNWKKTSDWNENILLEYSMQPIQQIDYTKCKNATDMAMVIDAMDILYSNKVDIFCIVTSDSDFTKLAMRLRESKAFVIGMGESKTPNALTKACDKFKYLDLITDEEPDSEANGRSEKDNKKVKVTQKEQSNVTPIEQIQEAVMNMIAKDESVNLSAIGSLLNRQFPDFDVRNYGYSKLSVFIREKLTRVKVEDKRGAYCVALKNNLDRNELSKEVVSIIKGKGGEVENLSEVLNELKSRHKHFSLKDYGFSRISSLLRSIEGVTVDGNKVKITTKKK